VTAPDHASLTKHGRARYVVTLEPLPHVDGVKALRWLLKAAGRRYGLKCVDLAEADVGSLGDHPPHRQGRGD
jgi:hypothetical protein